jgi:membrane associated rhomboid family serine protease
MDTTNEQDFIRPLQQELPFLKQTHSYGYIVGGQVYGCTKEELKKTIYTIGPSNVQYVWTPESETLLLPEQSELALEIYKESGIKGARRGIGVGVALLVLPIGAALILADWSLLFHSLFFILGVAVFVNGVWQLNQARKLTKEEVAKTIADERTIINRVKDLGNAALMKPVYQTYVIAGCIGAVYLAQMYVGIDPSADIAGQVKVAIREGEYWRLFTASLLHYGPVHLIFNSMALWNVGRAIEQQLSNTYVSIVFFFSALLGAVFSQVLSFNSNSIGASGGIIGMIGFLAVAAYIYKEFFPRSYFKVLLQNIGLIAVIGIVGFAVIDNAAHLGGLFGGIGLGFLLLNKKSRFPDEPSDFVKALGVVCLGAIVLVALFAVWIIIKSFS